MELTNDVWARDSQTEILTTFGSILGCGLAAFETEGKLDKGKGRLFHILVSETAYLVWRLRNERRIQDAEGPTKSTNEIYNRWMSTINKRITLDGPLTNAARFKSNTIKRKLVLVGILAARSLTDPG